MSPERDRDRDYEDIDGEMPAFMPVVQVRAKFFMVPVVVVIILAGILAYLTYFQAQVQITATPFSEEELGEATGGLLNGLFYFAIAALSSFFIVFLVKKKGEDALKYVLGVAFLLLGTMLIYFFGSMLLFLAGAPEFDYYILLVAGGAATVGLVVLLNRDPSPPKKNFAVILIGTLIGAFMGVVMPTWTTVMILLGISVWDVISVKRGPIKQILELTGMFDGEDYDDEAEDEWADLTPEERRREFRASTLEIGIGDLAFYSVLTSHTLIATSSVVAAVIAAAGIIVGCGITINALKNNRILPGLPISIVLGVLGLIIGGFVAGRVHFALFFA